MLRFYEHTGNGLIYFLRDGKVYFMPRGMKWDDAFEADMDASVFPVAIVNGTLKEIK